MTAARCPNIATTARAMSQRKGRVYVDFVQNGHGKLLVSPFCVRPLPGAPVSMPLRWTDVTEDLTIERFTIRSAPAFLDAMGDDPMLAVLALKPDLEQALARMSALVDLRS